MRAAERFVEEVEAAVAATCGTPERWSRFDGEARRMLLRRYPYVVIYCVLTDRIQVLAVAHVGADPATGASGSSRRSDTSRGTWVLVVPEKCVEDS